MKGRTDKALSRRKLTRERFHPARGNSRYRVKLCSSATAHDVRPDDKIGRKSRPIITSPYRRGPSDRAQSATHTQHAHLTTTERKKAGDHRDCPKRTTKYTHTRSKTDATRTSPAASAPRKTKGTERTKGYQSNLALSRTAALTVWCGRAIAKIKSALFALPKRLTYTHGRMTRKPHYVHCPASNDQPRRDKEK